MNIGERIRQKRNERNWSQRDLAEKMGYSNHSTVGKIETGKVDLPQSKVVQFAEVLGVSVAYLMGWEEEVKKPTVQDDRLSEGKQQLIDFAKSVPEDKIDLVLKIMKSIVEAD